MSKAKKCKESKLRNQIPIVIPITKPTAMEMYSGKIEFSLMSGVQIAKMASEWKTWEDNRAVDQARILRLITIQEKKCSDIGRFDFYFNPIVLCQLNDSKDLKYLIDGQHRVATIQKMYEKYNNKEENKEETNFLQAFEKIECLIMNVRCIDRDEISYNFERVNSGTPLPPSYYDKKISGIIDGYLKWLEEKFPGLEKPSKSPHRPNYNEIVIKETMSSVQDFRNAIIDGKVNEDHLIEVTEVLNKDLGKTFTSRIKRSKLPEKIIEKLKSSKFFLGEEKMDIWARKVVDQVLQNSGYDLESEELV